MFVKVEVLKPKRSLRKLVSEENVIPKLNLLNGGIFQPLLYFLCFVEGYGAKMRGEFVFQVVIC